MLAMESLEQLTRSHDCKAIASKHCLKGECVKTLVSFVESSDLAHPTDMEASHSFLMKRKALTILANSLCALSESGDLNDCLGCSSDLKTRSFVSALISSVRDSSLCPHNAGHAARCMQYIAIARDVQDLLADLGALSAASSACAVGACRSLSLERESKKLRLELGNCR
jgi:hypothetical protein